MSSSFIFALQESNSVFLLVLLSNKQFKGCIKNLITCESGDTEDEQAKAVAFTNINDEPRNTFLGFFCVVAIVIFL